MKHILRIFIILLLSVGCHKPGEALTHQNMIGIWEVRGGAMILKGDMTAAISSSHQVGTWSLDPDRAILVLDLKAPSWRKEFRIQSLIRGELMELTVDGLDGIIRLNYVSVPPPE